MTVSQLIICKIYEYTVLKRQDELGGWFENLLSFLTVSDAFLYILHIYPPYIYIFLLLFTLLFLLLSSLLDIFSESKNFNNKTYCWIVELLLRSIDVYRDSIFIQIFTHKILMRADLILRVCFLFFTFSDRFLPSPLCDLKGTKSWKTLYR